MNAIAFDDDGVTVDAEFVASGFGITQKKVRELMASGVITARSETGQGDDAGRTRLNFLYGNRVLRFIIDEDGTLISPAKIDYTNAELSAARNCAAGLQVSNTGN